MSLPRQLPIPTVPDTKNPASVERYMVRLNQVLSDWMLNAATEVQRLRQFPTPVTEAVDGVRTVFTVPVLIEVEPGGMPKTQLAVDGKVIPYTTTDPPPAGQWTLREVDQVTQQIVIGTAPVTDAHLPFLVARQR